MSKLVKGKNVVIFPNCVIGRPPMAPAGTTEIDYSELPDKPVHIGDNTVIGANTVIYNDVKIGANCLIVDGVYIREGVTIGDGCIVGIGCKIGARTSVGDGTRIMDLSNIASDAYLANNVFIGPGVMMGNDNSMGRNSNEIGRKHKGPRVKEWATVGMNATVLPGRSVGRNSIVGAGSVVTKAVGNDILVMGVPARFVRKLRGEEIR